MTGNDTNDLRQRIDEIDLNAKKHEGCSIVTAALDGTGRQESVCLAQAGR